MAWYDWFARVYDRSLEPLYVDARQAAARAMDLRPDSTVLDLPCGTGQSFEVLARPLLPSGRIIGVDRSSGMLDQARRRVTDRKWPHVHLVCEDVQQLDVERLERAVGERVVVDRVLVFLGFTAFPDWTGAFDRLWEVLRPGGRMVIVDVYAERLGLQGRMVNLVARADIRRPVWEPLRTATTDFEHHDLPSLARHGGCLFLATGTKPQEPARAGEPASATTASTFDADHG